ncbi:pilus assembly protein CpaA [Paramagnetospirillum kuznetsovii]|uniref:Pilus assembly protein CpaA n=1 Tax=Paramagnetospirillum kuznetsovii TaxID=2053833 RepID=A0A364NVL6_9PROT|nr:prepilin peptidase [Paramagnetospirillum kuznetsovii]RAU20945.1 pilus assembly protein CpaA [Paramagnetospirillum kuznetsovii]
MNGMIFIFSLAFVVALADAAVTDIRQFRIHNRVPLLLIASFAAAFAVGFDSGAWLGHLGAGGALFAVGAVLFVLGVWGGGDAKMLPAVALWTGFDGLSRFLMVMALVGGGLAVVALLARRVPLGPEGPVRAWGQRLAESGHVPYGVAIAAGGLDWWIMEMLPRVMG